jgi:hypothetical protein
MIIKKNKKNKKIKNESVIYLIICYILILTRFIKRCRHEILIKKNKKKKEKNNFL